MRHNERQYNPDSHVWSPDKHPFVSTLPEGITPAQMCAKFKDAFAAGTLKLSILQGEIGGSDLHAARGVPSLRVEFTLEPASGEAQQSALTYYQAELQDGRLGSQDMRKLQYAVLPLSADGNPDNPAGLAKSVLARAAKLEVTPNNSGADKRVEASTARRRTTSVTPDRSTQEGLRRVRQFIADSQTDLDVKAHAARTLALITSTHPDMLTRLEEEIVALGLKTELLTPVEKLRIIQKINKEKHVDIRRGEGQTDDKDTKGKVDVTAQKLKTGIAGSIGIAAHGIDGVMEGIAARPVIGVPVAVVSALGGVYFAGVELAPLVHGAVLHPDWTVVTLATLSISAGVKIFLHTLKNRKKTP